MSKHRIQRFLPATPISSRIYTGTFGIDHAQRDDVLEFSTNFGTGATSVCQSVPELNVLDTTKPTIGQEQSTSTVVHVSKSVIREPFVHRKLSGGYISAPIAVDITDAPTVLIGTRKSEIVQFHLKTKGVVSNSTIQNVVFRSARNNKNFCVWFATVLSTKGFGKWIVLVFHQKTHDGLADSHRFEEQKFENPRVWFFTQFLICEGSFASFTLLTNWRSKVASPCWRKQTY